MDVPHPPRCWFSPNPFLRKMECFSVAPLLFCLTASASACEVFIRIQMMSDDAIERMYAPMIAMGCVWLALVCYTIANIFVAIGFFQLDYPNSPKGLVSKILYRFSTVVALVWFVFLLRIAANF